MKPITWVADEAGRLDATVKKGTPLSNNKARDAVRTGKVQLDGERVRDPAAWVQVGQTLHLDMAAPNPDRTEPFGLQLVYRDQHIVVVDKPAGLPSAPLPNDARPTALDGVKKMLRNAPGPKVVHRLDMRTSGLMVFARGVPAARKLRDMLDAHEVRRVYRCVVAGAPRYNSGLITSMLVKDAGQGRSGSRGNTLRTRPVGDPDPGPMPGPGKHAITRFWVRERAAGHAALEVELSTGRRHQIRIHLAEIGCPVLGEAVYARNGEAPRQALHSAVLELAHPRTGQPLRFESPWPNDLRMVTPIGKGW